MFLGVSEFYVWRHIYFDETLFFTSYFFIEVDDYILVIGSSACKVVKQSNEQQHILHCLIFCTPTAGINVTIQHVSRYGGWDSIFYILHCIVIL